MKNDDFNVFVRTVVKRLLDMSGNKNDIRFSGKTTPTEFEKLVVEASKTVIMENGYVCSIDYVEGGHTFPDIVYNFDGSKYGIEVKSSTNSNSPDDSWTILGNSILGSTRIDVNDMHIIYIKINKNGCFVNHARYEDAVSDVVVTHSPRYKINLSQHPEESFFARSGISYEEIKESDDPIGLVTSYFRRQGETAWWIAESTPATIKTWNEIGKETRKEILSKAYLLFPELIYSGDSTKYKRLAKWLVANYSIVDSSLRDRFTAGGRIDLKIDHVEYAGLPRIYETFRNIAEDFKKQVIGTSLEELNKYWDAYSPERDDYSARISYWLNMIHCHLEENRQSETGKDFLNALIDKISRP